MSGCQSTLIDDGLCSLMDFTDAEGNDSSMRNSRRQLDERCCRVSDDCDTVIGTHKTPAAIFHAAVTT
jgi:hypothetical protein